ncbi:claudin-4-like [Latimeria chalumnae]|uniref:Claudin n=1 Tax=Latimeria chalumnae TaxID=7897 RepID=H3A7A1_LATCH|nr:PREDICTED: claudin-4-like [Latimeria chalumnae]|eukprot:XP_006011255.1 PREDICTED: claudin-4-like [Latimeria chalumnae]
MGSSGIQVVGVAVAIIGLIGAIVCCALPRWKETSFSGQNIVTAQTTLEGIWMNCVVQSTGQMQCKVYDSLLSMPQDLQAARALTVISIVVSIFGVLLTFVGAEFTVCVEDNSVKSKICLTAGVVIIIAGLLLIIPVSWSAHTVIQDFKNPLNLGNKMEIGASIFIGWASSVLLMIAGGLLICFRPKDEGGYSAKYYSNSAPSAPGKNYV